MACLWEQRVADAQVQRVLPDGNAETKIGRFWLRAAGAPDERGAIFILNG